MRAARAASTRYPRLPTCWTTARPRFSVPSCRSTSPPRSRWGRRTSPTRPGSTCRRQPCATTWRRSSRRATWCSRTRRPVECRPIAGTGSSSITSPSPGRVDATTTREVGEFFEAAHGRLEEMLHHTSDLLTRLTHNAAVVLGPKAEAAAIRSVQLVRLSAERRDRGVRVQQRRRRERGDRDSTTTRPTRPLAAAGAHLAASLIGGTLA